MPRSHRAFTLVELMVVVAIIAVLLALLTPAMDKAIEAAKRAICASNLHGWGGAHAMYYSDNKRQLPTPPNLWADLNHGNGWVYPNNPWVWSQADKLGDTGQWNAQAYASYNGALSYSAIPTKGTTATTPGAGPVGGQRASTNGPGTGATVSKIFLCPSNPRFEEMYVRNNDNAQRPPADMAATDANPSGAPFIDGHYSYFGRVSKWQRTPGTPINAVTTRAPWAEELVDKELASKVLMNCFFRLDNGKWDTWGKQYSHGDAPAGGYPKMDGNNQLYGDGGVAWWGPKHYNPGGMQNAGEGVGGPASKSDSK